MGSGMKPGVLETAPPPYDQKLAGLMFCQSFQSLSTICERRWVRKASCRSEPTHCVMQHKQGIYQKIRTAGVGVGTPTEGAPFGDHLAPNTQLTAPEGHSPSRSLCRFCERTKGLQYAEEVDAPSYNPVNRSMRASFKLCLEANEVPCVAV